MLSTKALFVTLYWNLTFQIQTLNFHVVNFHYIASSISVIFMYFDTLSLNRVIMSFKLNMVRTAPVLPHKPSRSRVQLK